MVYIFCFRDNLLNKKSDYFNNLFIYITDPFITLGFSAINLSQNEESIVRNLCILILIIINIELIYIMINQPWQLSSSQRIGLNK
jgi:hypothetical protein